MCFDENIKLAIQSIYIGDCNKQGQKVTGLKISDPQEFKDGSNIVVVIEYWHYRSTVIRYWPAHNFVFYFLEQTFLKTPTKRGQIKTTTKSFFFNDLLYSWPFSRVPCQLKQYVSVTLTWLQSFGHDMRKKNSC